MPHSRMLDHLDTAVDSTERKLSRATAQIKHFLERAEGSPRAYMSLSRPGRKLTFPFLLSPASLLSSARIPSRERVRLVHCHPHRHPLPATPSGHPRLN
jgi:hypothetical protein